MTVTRWETKEPTTLEAICYEGTHESAQDIDNWLEGRGTFRVFEDDMRGTLYLPYLATVATILPGMYVYFNVFECMHGYASSSTMERDFVEIT